MQSDKETIPSHTEPAQDLLERMFMPLARLCLANGIRFDTAEEQLKRSFIIEAQALQPAQPEHGKISRVTAATGINRRETTRLLRETPTRHSPKIPLASQVIARWSADPRYRTETGLPLALPRQGDCPSFESLIREITRDLHPRTVLEELLRLKLVNLDEAGDLVQLQQQDYIPGNDQTEMLTLLGDNVGDHLESAVANLLKDDVQHHDQAIFADELSEESIKALAPLIRQQWYSLRDKLVPVITDLLETDQRKGRPQNQRIRIGLYSFSEPWTAR